MSEIVLEKNDNPFITNRIDKTKKEKIELEIHSDIIDYFKKKSKEIGIPFNMLIDRYLSKALNPL